MPSQAMLAKIHIAKKELGLDDTEYRELLCGVTGKTSAGEMDNTEAAEVIKVLIEKGWQPGIPPSEPVLSKAEGKGEAKQGASSSSGLKTRFQELDGRPGMATAKQLRMIEAVWMTSKGVQIKTGEALRRFLKSKFQIDGLRFVERDQVGKIKTAIESIRS